MNLHEYQAKAILRDHGIRVPAGEVAETPGEATAAAERIGGERWMVKAQIAAGGRAEGTFKGQELKSGIRAVTNLVNVGTESRSMLGHRLITAQTGADGLPVDRVYIEQAMRVESEIALMLVVDEYNQSLVLLLSAGGGTGIESTLRDDPSAVVRIPVSIDHGPDTSALDDALSRLGLDETGAASLHELVARMVSLAGEMDLTLLEINPAGLAGDEYIVLDAKIIADDNALYRQPGLVALDAQDSTAGNRRRASSDGFNYIRMDGDIACMTVGAGLSMATLDTLMQFGGRPANFLDLPPDSKVNRVTSALELLLGGDGIRCLLINVFGGGIMRCDTVSDALQIINSVHPFRVPVVVRLAGTNADLASRRLRESMPGVVQAHNMADAARVAVQLAKTGKRADPRKVESWLQKIVQRVSGQQGEGRE
jgi:succinyl-CoA synthetase beta subunit